MVKDYGNRMVRIFDRHRVDIVMVGKLLKYITASESMDIVAGKHLFSYYEINYSY